MRTRLLTLLIVLGAALPIIAHAQSWTPLTSGVTNDLNDIACVDERACYVVGGAPIIGGPGIVLKTTDGGDTWVVQITPITDTARGSTHPLRGISCPTATTCYAAGDGGVILKTTNGGSAWVRQSVPNLSTFPGQAQPWFWDIWAPTATTAVAVGNVGAVYRTTNGGDTWTQLVIGLENHNLSGVFFVNATIGWLVGGPRQIHKTTDAGATWIAQTVDTGTIPLSFSDVFSLDGATVWASGPFTFAVKSTDGGVSWTQVNVPPAGGFHAIEFLNGSTGWMGGNGGYLTTTDGGATWGLVFTNKFERSIDCPGSSVCYMVGDDGTMRRYGTLPPPPQPDLTVGDRSLTCPAGELGLEFAEYRYRVVVTNSGTAASGPFTVRIEGVNAAGAAVGTPVNRTVADLAAGASTTIEGQANVGLLNPTAATTATIRVTTDVLGQVTESNEANNTGTIEQTCVTVAPTTPTPVPAPAISSTPVPATATPVTPSSTAETTPSMTAAPTPTVVPPSTIVTQPTATTSPVETPPQEIAPSAPSLLVGERPVAAVPTAVEQPASTPTMLPEEKRVMEEAARRVQLETIRADAPKVLLGIERFVQEKGIVRSDMLEAFAAQKVQAIAEATLPALPTPKATEVRGALTTFIAYGTEPTAKLGAGERAGVVNSYQTAFGKLPETQQDWEDVMKISVGRFPSQKSAEREAAAEATFQKIYLRSSDAVNPNDRAAISIIAYGLRPANRRLASESVAIRSFKRIYKRAPSSAGDWDTVRCVAYSGAKR